VPTIGPSSERADRSPVGQENRPLANAHLLEHDGKAGRQAGNGDRPAHGAAGIDGQEQARCVEFGVEDAHLARQEGRELGIHAEGGHRQDRIGRLAHHDIVEGDRGKGQQLGGDGAAHLDLVPDEAGSLGLEGGAIARPVHETRTHKQDEKTRDQQAAEDDEQPQPLRLPQNSRSNHEASASNFGKS
jgi:hypothetical protein